MEFNPLIPFGTKIKIEKSKIENLLDKKNLKAMPPLIIGEVIDYKMTDGMGIGYVLLTEDNQKIWIFSNELDDQTKREYKINNNSISSVKGKDIKLLNFKKLKYEMNGNRDIKTIANPLNLISWLIFTLKDIF